MLDTNVVVSGFLSAQGPPGQLLDLVLAGEIVPVFDNRMLAEYREVLLRLRFGLDAEDVDAVLAHVERIGISVVAPLLDVELGDGDDLPFLEVAAASGAPLVTGNARHFRPRRGRHQVKVITAVQALQRIRSGS